jgi:hypothetical protein
MGSTKRAFPSQSRVNSKPEKFTPVEIQSVVLWVITNVSEELTASIFSVKVILLFTLFSVVG